MYIYEILPTFACANVWPGIQHYGGGSISDFGCSYNTLYTDSLDNLDFCEAANQMSLQACTNSNVAQSNKSPMGYNKVVDTSSVQKSILRNQTITRSLNNEPLNQYCTSNKGIHCAKRIPKQNHHSLRNQARKISPSAYSEIIRPTSEQYYCSRNRRSKSLRQSGNPVCDDFPITSCDHTRRKLSSVSKRNSRYKLMKDKCSSDDTDTSIVTSKFGDYLSTLSACPSLENCASKGTSRKSKKLLPKESKSSREKCHEFVHKNFNPLTSSNIMKPAYIEKAGEKVEMHSSSTDLTPSEVERMDFVYSDDSLNDAQIERNARDNTIDRVYEHIIQNAGNVVSGCGNIKHPAILAQELEVLRRQLRSKEIELAESSRVNSRLSPACSTYQFSPSSSICPSQHSTWSSYYHDIVTDNHNCYTYEQHSPSLKSKETYKSPSSLSCNFQYQDQRSFRQCYSPFLYPSPEPQILNDEHNDRATNFYSLPRLRKSTSKQPINSNSVVSIQSTNKSSSATCSCSVDMMSQPVQSLLKYFHPAKNSSPHSAFSNSRSSLRSDVFNDEIKKPLRLSLTSQFWSNKQINRNRGITHYGSWNLNKSANSSIRFANSRRNITSRESDHGVTPFGCTGFFIPASKMKSSRRQSDPFVTTCSRKTLDLMRSIHLPVSSANQMSYQYLSRIMKLDNELKIIPERLTLSSKLLNRV